jgi:exodeoxyribonuclease V alpha subunit
MTSTMAVEVKRVLYPREGAPHPAGTFCVLATSRGRASGEIGWRPRVGERLNLTGRYDVYKGEQQFKWSAATPDVPVDARDQLRYICSRTDGFGPAMEAAIWARWGEQWIDRAMPDEIPRLGGERYGKLRAALAEFERERERSEAIAWLMGKGCTPKLAQSAWDEWEMETVGIVRDDCFALARLHRRGFAEIDTRVRSEFGVGDDDPRRMRAAVLYVIDQARDRGSTLIAWDDIWPDCVALIGDARIAQISDATRELIAGETLVAFSDVQAIATIGDHRAERAIWEYAR